MRRWHKVLAAGAVTAAVLVPSGVALAATNGPGPGNVPAVTQTCTGDHQMLQLRDGTGWRHTADGTTVQLGSAQGHQHMSGPQDGSGPRVDRPMDGTGNQWGTSG